MSELQALDKQYVAGTYARFSVEIVRGKGSLVYDTEGKEYIDLGTGIGVTAFGVGDEGWKAAVIGQLDLVQHTSNLYYTEPCARLAELLCAKTGLKKVFFGNSGAEANECAIKVARKYAAEKKGAEYNVIVTLKNSFHGRTLTTLAATGQEHYHELYQPLTPGFVHTEAGNMEELVKIVAEYKVAGVLIECIQGEGGVNVVDGDYIRAVATLCEKEDILFMVDEVQTGNGRTGKLYAYMNFGVVPDVVTTAKGLGGGLPIGACLLGEKVEGVLGFGDHGSTYGGNPIACAGACNVISRVDDELLAEVVAKGDYLKKAFEGAKGVKSVSGLGLMVGIETERPAAEVVKAAIGKGVLALTAKNKVRLLPALNIPMEQLKKAVEILLSIMAE
jgi:acetylornithine/N-succinyldiaminopimelate aminotransferase